VPLAAHTAATSALPSIAGAAGVGGLDGRIRIWERELTGPENCRSPRRILSVAVG
jgi:hypothetical protein